MALIDVMPQHANRKAAVVFITPNVTEQRLSHSRLTGRKTTYDSFLP